ncbi:HAD family hydrolase [Pseudalkalibacillus salsuginis]|uniref:HAD family hydrolase n=1 Tax=Pseudalkalibacillus salsuginis TaxID=2910972 RepID=UPI001F2C6840|nr:HAD family hydrolase [Pseudalkalibacillus salsuginis]MCF6411135.1 HAD hydrolase-like protein [Pseudalkalibacillus salsuginis]
MKQFYPDCKLIIFDLDGTLYEDTDHFDYYASLLKEKVAIDEQEYFIKDYEDMKKGDHPVAIGKAYDVERDAILTLDPLTLKVTHAQKWDGTEWDSEDVNHTYDRELTFDFEKMIAIGDGWWLPYSAARHYGVSIEETYHCYTKTKEFMVTDEFQLTKTPGLKEGLHKLREEAEIVLVTNSEKDDVERLLNELELDDLFPEIIPLAQKPVQTKKIFLDLMKKYGVKANETVSIGDNLINEIAPALLLGLKTIYIQPTGIKLEHANLKVVTSLADVFNKGR